MENNTYYDNLDEEAIEMLGNMPPVDTMIFDLERGMKTAIGFCGRHEDNILAVLAQFVKDHTEFAHLIQPILDYDPEYASAGEIIFHRSGEVVVTRLRLNAAYTTQQNREILGEMGLPEYREFVRLTEPFGCFTTGSNGEFALNYG